MLEFRILGPLEVLDVGGTINLGGPQQRRVMSVLLCEPGRVLTYDRLVEVLWPNRDEPDNARRSAITYVSRLRAAVGDGVIGTTDAGYVLQAKAVSVDADRFVALTEHATTVSSDEAVAVLDEALGLWRGPTFGDLTDEWWAQPLGKKLAELRFAAMAQRVEAMSSCGWHDLALAEVTSLADGFPLREQFSELAMRLLHTAGRSSEALRVYQQHRSALAEQTGLDPSAALIDLERSIVVGASLETAQATSTRRQRGYVLHELIGEGSFGSVYRATQPGVQRDVALKVIRRELADDRTFVRRFEVEAQLIARLEHPHIVPLYDFWREPGGAFLAFRLLRGGTALDRLQRNGPLSVDQVTSLITQIGSALGAAHAGLVVHRDVKPANILFDEAGVSYLSDFGIAASLGDQPSIPQRWSAGSVLYASPEQLRDGIDDANADQYALAVTAWELLVGRPPFSGENASSVVATKLRDGLPPLPRGSASFTTGISDVLRQAGSVHPSERFADVAAFVAAWQRATVADTDRGVAERNDLTERTHAQTVTADIFAAANPYKGLRPFREADAADFHGRIELVDALAAQLNEAPLVAVVGPSGSGKSSIVLAGLVPRVRAKGALVAAFSPGIDPFAALSDSLNPIARAEHSELISAAALCRPGGLVRAIEALASSDQLILVIDQCEELWTVAEDSERRAFCEALAGAANTAGCKVVLTIRADFFDRPLTDPALGPLVAAHAFGVTPMTATELQDAITAPAAKLGLRFDPALVGRLVAETIDQPGSLPLLQFALAELFEGRRGATITSEAYEELGGLASSLKRQADEIYMSFSRSDRDATRRLFSRLVTPGVGTEHTRRRVSIREVAGVPDSVIQAFVDRRLLTTDHDRSTREPTIELAHEVLLRSWTRLIGWLREDAAWLSELRNLSAASSLWSASNNDDADLLRGGRLAIVSELAVSRPGALTEVEQRFLDASTEKSVAEQRAAEARLADKVQQNRRLRRSLVGIGVVAALAVGTGAIAVVQRNRAGREQRAALDAKSEADTQRTEAERQAREAEDQRKAATEAEARAQNSNMDSRLTALATGSLNARSTQRDLAALLAIEAWDRRPDPLSKSALFGTFTYDPGFYGYLRVEDAFQLQGAGLVGTSTALVGGYHEKPGGPILVPQVTDMITGEVIRTLEPLVPDWENPDVVDTLDIGASTNGKFGILRARLSAPTNETVFAAYDLATGTKVGVNVAVATTSYSFAVNDTGSVIAVVTDGAGAVEVYATDTGQLISSIPGVQGAPSSPRDSYGAGVAFGPDANLYVGSQSTKLRVFDSLTWTVVQEISVPKFSTSVTLRFLNDGALMVAKGLFADERDIQQGAVTLVDLTAGTVRWGIEGNDYGYGECDSFAVDAPTQRLWCGDYFGLIRERSLTTGVRTGQSLQAQRGWVRNMDIVDTTNGRVLVAFGQNIGSIARWGINSNGPIQRQVAVERQTVSLIGDGSTMLVGTENGLAFPFNLDYALWDTSTDTEIPGLPRFLYARAIGDLIYGAFADGTIGSYDVATRVRTTAFDSIDPVPVAARFSEDGKFLVLGYPDGRVKVIDSATKQPLVEVKAPQSGSFQRINAVDISSDGRRLYVVGIGIFVFDVATGDLLATGTGAPGNVVVTSQGDVVVAYYDGRISVLDPETLEETAALPAARGFVQTMNVTSDGSMLLAIGNDQSASLYDLGARIRLGDQIQLDLGRGSGGAGTIAPDGGLIAITGRNFRGSSLWSLDTETWVQATCKIAGRNLTREEWASYIGDLGEYRATCPEFPVDA
jgi:DNA-binding SARP family transcriptional activator/WD40 repeat protein